MKNCLICNKEYYKPYDYSQARWEKRKFCSHKCGAIGGGEKRIKEAIIKYCLVCEQKLFVKPWLKGIKKYCSRECQYKHMFKKQKIDCQTCGRNFYGYIGNQYKLRKFCSIKCSSIHASKYPNRGCFRKGRIPQNRRSVLRNCLICEKEFTVSLAYIKNGGGKYCSYKCSGIAKRGTIYPTRGKPNYKLKGKNHWNWKGGITEEIQKIRNSLEHKEWAKCVLRRDYWTCQICSYKGQNLIANHIKKFSDYPKLRFDSLNGITLCNECHCKWVNRHETEWESYFNFNLKNRGFLPDENLPIILRQKIKEGTIQVKSLKV